MNSRWATHKQTGFTIVELLVVIVVIGILAAITIVAYNGIQNRANDAAVQSDAATIRKKMEIAKLDLGHYPTTYAEMPDLKITKSVYDTGYYNLHYCYESSIDGYAVSLRSKSNTSFVVSNEGIKEVAGRYLGSATCGEAGGSTWGERDAGWVGYGITTDSWNQSWSWTAD